MKTILWVCNTPLPEIQRIAGINNYNEGWLIGISNQLRKREEIALHYAFPQNRHKKTIERIIDGIHFWGFYNCHKNLYIVKDEGIQTFKEIINQVKPDVIHIFGTEFSHSLECVESVSDKGNIVVSIQGLTSEIAKVYLRGIPFRNILAGRFVNGRYHCLLTDKMDFYRRGLNEKKLISTVENVIGRTEWDHACVKNINPICTYYHCNETLRNTFYSGEWEMENIEKYAIFVMQANYPIKGLHVLISALPLIKRKYPKVLVYIAGSKDFMINKSPYGLYIKFLIKKYRVEKNIVFLGYLTDEKIKERMLKTHVMLMPSLIENSPNSIGEAMLLGTPVVAANVGGVRSIMQEGREGYLYPCFDKNKMVKKICRIFDQDKLAVRFSQNERRRARELYDRLNNAGQLLSIYNEIINANG